MKKRRIFKRKYRTHLSKPVVYRHIDFFFNNDTKHYFLTIANNKNLFDGHDMTSHPPKSSNGSISRAFVKLLKNPELGNHANSYIKKKIRRNVSKKYADGKRRLRKKYLWKLGTADKRHLFKLDKRYWKKKNTCKHQHKR